MGKYSSKTTECWDFIGHPRVIKQNVLIQISLIDSYVKRLAALAVICEVESSLPSHISAMVTSCLYGRLEFTSHHLLGHKVWILCLKSNIPFFLQKGTRSLPLQVRSPSCLFLTIFPSPLQDRGAHTALWSDFIILQRYHMSLAALCFIVYPQFCKLNMSEWLCPGKSIFNQINISMPIV